MFSNLILILTGTNSALYSVILPVVLFIFVIYFFIMRPEKKRRQQAYSMQSQLSINDKIVTIGGIHGVIDNIADDVVTIILVSGAKMNIEKGAIKRNIKG